MHKNCNMFHTYTHNKYCSGDNLWTILEDKLPISTFSTFCNTGYSISGCTSQLGFYSSAYYPVSSLSSQAFHLDAFQASTVLVVLSLTIFFASPINHTTPIRSTVMSWAIWMGDLISLLQLWMKYVNPIPLFFCAFHQFQDLVFTSEPNNLFYSYILHAITKSKLQNVCKSVKVHSKNNGEIVRQ